MVYMDIYGNIWGILMVNGTIYGIHTDPMGIDELATKNGDFLGPCQVIRG